MELPCCRPKVAFDGTHHASEDNNSTTPPSCQEALRSSWAIAGGLITSATGLSMMMASRSATDSLGLMAGGGAMTIGGVVILAAHLVSYYCHHKNSSETQSLV